MTGKLLIVLGLASLAWSADLVREVRAAIDRKDLAAAARLVEEYRARHGVNPEMLEGLSWLGRGALFAGDLETAERYAAEVRELSLERLRARPLDQERRLPIAFGASIEVQAQVLARRGALSEAIAFLQQELETWGKSSIRTRIQKNINLLSLEGKPAPEIEFTEYLGERPPALAELRGKTVLVFLWAHWCKDCKTQAPVLARLKNEFANRGLVIIGPTQRYGFAERGREVSAEEELAYIDKVRRESYAALDGMPVPVSEKTFQIYGASTTPTLVLIDRKGIVRLYHPGEMSYEELAPRIRELLGG